MVRFESSIYILSTSEVKGLIAKFGGSKLSDIDPSNYEAIIKEAEVLGNE